MIETRDSFLKYRQGQETAINNDGLNDSKLTGVITVEINITDLCNRKCVFCPRVDPKVYPNRNVFISEIILEEIINQLTELNYRAKISLSGFGEPLLNKDIVKIVSKLDNIHEDVIVETNTNGDKLTAGLLADLIDAGIKGLYWNLYDGEHQIDQASSIIEKVEKASEIVRLRPHWPGFSSDKFSLFLNNRGGALLDVNKDYISTQSLPLKRSCNYPFYKLFIDWNGDVLSCSNDWMRKSVIGNISHEKLDVIWHSSKQTDLRKKLLDKNRCSELCQSCDIDGGLFGSKSVEIFKQKYA